MTLDIRYGDAFDLFDTLPPASIDCIITSPPYWGHRSYGQSHDWNTHLTWITSGQTIDTAPPYAWYRDAGGVLGLEPTPAWYVAHLVEILHKSQRCLKPTGSLWVNLGDTYFARWASIREDGRQGLSGGTRARRRTPMGGYCQEKQLLLIPTRFAIAMQDRRWIVRNDVIWLKRNVPPRPEADRLRLAHEHLFHFVHRPPTGRASYYYDTAAVEPGALGVVDVPVAAGDSGHSATFPVDLIRPRILSSCPPGGLVLDPFCGTGRALTVAEAAGRRAIGFDLRNWSTVA